MANQILYGFYNFLPQMHHAEDSAFSPLSVSGCVLWLDGGDADTVFTDAGITPATTGNSLAQWSDKSGNGNHATASSPKPTLGTDEIAFNISPFTLSAEIALSSLTIFLVGKLNAENGNYNNMYLGGSGASSKKSYIWWHDLPGNKALRVANYQEVSITTANIDLYNPTDYLLLEFAIGPTSTITINGTQVATATPANTLFPISLVGGAYAVNYHLQGKIRELIVYSGLLGTTDKSQIRDYLTAKWNL